MLGDGERRKRCLKAVIMAALVLACAGATHYFHFMLKIEMGFTHFFYVPIVIAAMWWGLAGAWVAVFLGAWLLGTRFASGLPAASTWVDLLRASMLLTVGLVLGSLREKSRRTEAQLRETRDFLNSLVSEATNPILVWDRDGAIIVFNRALEELTGCLASEQIGRPARDLFSIDAYERLKAALGQPFPKPVEAPINCHGSGEAVVLWSPAVVSGESGPAAFMVQGQDITKRKWAEDLMQRHAVELQRLNQQLARSEHELRETNKAKDRFFSIISHDLRSPFVPILQFSEMLIRELDDLSREKVQEYAQAIHHSAKRLYGLVENLLDWSRIQLGKVEVSPSRIDLRELTEETLNVLEGYASGKEIRLKNEVPSECPVWADRNHVERILQNLVSNGIKFTCHGGEVRVGATRRDGPVSVSVADTGVGMDDYTRQALFRIDTCHTTPGTAHEKGSGLGLIICKELVEKNGGTIEVASTPNRGSTFSFTLPAERPA